MIGAFRQLGTFSGELSLRFHSIFLVTSENMASQLEAIPPSKPSTWDTALSHEEVTRLEASLILGTTYPLNQSETKRISVGLQPQVNGDIRPIIKLQNNNSSGGIVFDSAGFSKLQNHYPAIAKFFTGGTNPVWGSSWRTPAPITIENCEIIFTTSFGAKAVVIDRRLSDHIKEIENGESTSKKSRNYTPAIVMQKITFEGLCNLTPCIEERFRRLQRIAPSVFGCMNMLCAELILHIPPSNIDTDIDETRIKELIKNNCKTLKDAIRFRLDVPFADQYFGIVFVESTTLCVPYITNELKKTIMESHGLRE